MDKFDIVGKKIHSLFVESYDGLERIFDGKKWTPRHFYACRCVCGKRVRVIRGNLSRNHTRSCGCLKSPPQAKNKGWRGHGGISGRVWGRIVRKAKERNLEVEVTIEEAWQKFQDQGGLCALTGWPLELASIKGKYTEQTASFDRIDSDLGYVRSNIQWIHKDINRMKNYFSESRFLEVCRAVVAKEQNQGNVVGNGRG